MITPIRAAALGSSAGSSAGSPPASPRAPAHPDHSPPNPMLPRRAPLSSPAATAATTTTATTSTTGSLSGARAPHVATHSRHHAARSLRAQTLTRIAGSSSTPRTRLARGGPPRASVRARTRPRPPPDPPTLVRYHWSTIIILTLYLPLLIIPWIIVCILDVKPLTWYGTSYQTSGLYTTNDIAWVPRWVRASNILACFSSALAFPVVTTVLGHASVAFVQNVRRGQKVNARELLALADGCWMRFNGDRRAWLANVGSMLLVLGESPPVVAARYRAWSCC